MGRCAMCHAKEPGWEGIIAPPKGVVLDTDRDIAAHAREIYLQAGRSHAMPPANVTGVSEEERQLLASPVPVCHAGPEIRTTTKMTKLLIRGRVLTFRDEPQSLDDNTAYRYIEDGAVLVEDGRILRRETMLKSVPRLVATSMSPTIART